MDNGFFPDSPQHDTGRLREIIRDFATVIDAARPGLRPDLLSALGQIELEVDRVEAGAPIPEEYVGGDLWRRWNEHALYVAEEAIEEAQWDTRYPRFIQAGMENGYIIPSGQADPPYIWLLDVQQIPSLLLYLEAEGWTPKRLYSLFLGPARIPINPDSVKSMLCRDDGVPRLLPAVFAEALEARGYCYHPPKPQG